MLWSIGFLVTFLFGGLTGMILASPPLDFPVSDSYFVVAHFHYVVFGTVVFAMFAGFYFWWPKMTGRMLDERLGKIHFWTLFIGFHMTFLVQHWLGVIGMPRRYADYLASDGFTTYNTISTIGSFLLGASTLPFLYNVIKTHAAGRRSPPTTRGATAGRWSGRRPARRRGTTSLELPRIRSESPGVRPALPARRRDGHADREQEPARPGSTANPTSRAAPGVSVDEGRGLAVRGRASSSSRWPAVVYWLLAEEPVGTVALALHRRAGVPHRLLPAVHRAADRPAARGHGRRRDRRRRRRAGLLQPAQLVAAARSRSSRRRPSSASSSAGGCSSSGSIGGALAVIGLVFEYYRGEPAL